MAVLKRTVEVEKVPQPSQPQPQPQQFFSELPRCAAFKAGACLFYFILFYFILSALFYNIHI